MEILRITDQHEREKAIKLCKNLIEKHALVPVIGAGFSFETPTDNGGVVPSANGLFDELLYYIDKYSGYSNDELDDIKKSSLSVVANDFWNVYSRIPEDALKKFETYIQTNFLGLSFRKAFQEAFLDIRWPQIFSLNYDTLIEDYSKEYYPIIPYDGINRRYYGEKSRLYKLHGDAKRYLSTGNKRHLILSKDQYVESMMNTENADMLTELLTAFSSKSILFFGCGLSEELDLLYTAQLSVKERAKSIDPDHQAIIYISFENGDALDPFPARTSDRLSQYGVTHVFRVSSEEQSTDFFRELSVFSSSLSNPSASEFLEKFTSIRYDDLSSNDVNSRDYLFQENLIWKRINDHIITLPGFRINRTITKEIIDCINSGEPLCFISGNFYCGKTFALLETAKHFTTKKVYIFPSGTTVSQKQLEVLVEKKDTLLFFDARSLTTAQIKKISTRPELERISNNHSNFIVVIEATDAPMYNYIFEARNSSRTFRQFRIRGCLDTSEKQVFNERIGAISFPTYYNKDTLLDYIVRNEKELISDSERESVFFEPQKDLLAKRQKQRIKALIMLATEIRIPAKRAIQFGIDGSINDMIRCCRQHEGLSVIEKDYSMYCGDSSGYEFVCNSKYWIIRALSAFANTQPNSIDIIADAYLSIIQDNRRFYVYDVKFYQISEPYYFFDHIQLLFNHRWFSNSSKLMNAIYDKLLPVLSNSFQFLHQKAKGKLVIAQIQAKTKRFGEAQKSLAEAILHITRAIDLAKQYPEAKNIDETISHMTYTKGRILIEYSCISSSHVPQAVETCCDLYDSQKNIREDAYDFVKSVGNDKKSFEKFKRILVSDLKIREFQDLNTEKVEALLLRWTGKHYSFSKRKHR